MDLDDQDLAVRMLLGDHDAKCTRSFDEVFRSEGGQVLRTPIRAPRANAHAERWVQTVRAECPDWTLVLGRHQLLRLLRPTAIGRLSPDRSPCWSTHTARFLNPAGWDRRGEAPEIRDAQRNALLQS